ncbi:MAG: hypothetical protein ACLP1X_04275, partial [Polyangiaceae bacterium]
MVTATEVLGELQGHSSVTRMLLDWGLEDEHITGSLADRANALAKLALRKPETTTPNGVAIWDAIVELAASLWQERLERHEKSVAYDDQPLDPPPAVAKFLRALARDGFTVSAEGIRRMLPEEVNLPQAQDEVDALLEDHGFKTAKGHLDQARNAHGRGEWASANAQLRTFMDSLLDDIAARLDPARAANAATGQPMGDATGSERDGVLSIDVRREGHGSSEQFSSRPFPRHSGTEFA